MTRRRVVYATAGLVLAVAAVLAWTWIHEGRHALALIPIGVVAVCAEIIRRTADAWDNRPAGDA
jgi:hypothetical protein